MPIGGGRCPSWAAEVAFNQVSGGRFRHAAAAALAGAAGRAVPAGASGGQITQNPAGFRGRGLCISSRLENACSWQTWQRPTLPSLET